MSDIAGWVWRNSPAPWETVDALYYPTRNNLSHDERRLNVGSIDGVARRWLELQLSALRAVFQVYRTLAE